MNARTSRRLRQLANQIGELREDVRAWQVAQVAKARAAGRRDFFRQVAIAIGVGWLFRQQPQQPRHPVRVSGGTRHAIRGGGNVDVRVSAEAYASAHITAEVVPADRV